MDKAGVEEAAVGDVVVCGEGPRAEAEEGEVGQRGVPDIEAIGVGGEWGGVGDEPSGAEKDGGEDEGPVEVAGGGSEHEDGNGAARMGKGEARKDREEVEPLAVRDQR